MKLLAHYLFKSDFLWDSLTLPDIYVFYFMLLLLTITLFLLYSKGGLAMSLLTEHLPHIHEGLGWVPSYKRKYNNNKSD